MFQKISTILIWSEDYRRLADWYQHVFNLKINEELHHPKDTGILFEFPQGGPWLWIGQHSDVKGKNRDHLRMMFNISVESVTHAYEHLKEEGVPFIAEPFKAPTMDKWFATFSDPDGNTIQIIGKK